VVIFLFLRDSPRFQLIENGLTIEDFKGLIAKAMNFTFLKNFLFESPLQSFGKLNSELHFTNRGRWLSPSIGVTEPAARPASSRMVMIGKPF
jgi:hypothetical protein